MEKTASSRTGPAAFCYEQANADSHATTLQDDAKTFLKHNPNLSSFGFGVLTCLVWSQLARRARNWRAIRRVAASGKSKLQPEQADLLFSAKVEQMIIQHIGDVPPIEQERRIRWFARQIEKLVPEQSKSAFADE